jgi:2-methylcitrate dehydratase PrpD
MSGADTDGPTIAQRLAAHVEHLRDAPLPEPVVTMAKRCLLDQLGCQLQGARSPLVQSAYRLSTSLSARPESTIVLHGDRTVAQYAALANGAFGHSSELDDSSIYCPHPGISVIPAAMALAERQRAGGASLLRALITGYEIQTRAMGPLNWRATELGWHGLKVSGVFGAAGAACALLDTTVDQTMHAIAIAASESSSTLEFDQSGGEDCRTHAGRAARAGIEAALLALDGLTGPPTIFEGRRGIYRMFGWGAELDVEAVWTDHFHILDTTFKLYPSLGTTHAALDATRELMDREGVTADNAERIVVHLAPFAVPLAAGIRHPHDVIGAQASVAYSLALRLVKGSNELSLYHDRGLWSDPQIMAVADRVEVEAAELPPTFSPMGAIVEITLRDGRHVRWEQPAYRGQARNPPTEEMLRDKFRGLAELVLPETRVGELIEIVDRIETFDSMAPLVEALTAT